jgi:uncharacterized protein YfaQ (DUF2300 family)
VHAWKFARRLTAVFLLSLPMQVGADEGAKLAWLRDGRFEARQLSNTPGFAPPPLATTLTTPLGSLWKLFVFAYLEENGVAEAAYVCRVGSALSANEARDCCDPGERVARAPALARSCAPYFEPARLGISPAAWRRHWRKHAAADWLLDLDRVQAETEVRVEELLAALDTITPFVRAAAQAALMETSLTGNGRDAWPVLGTGLRYKTYTWNRRTEPRISYGGAAGWMADGTPFWFGARGSSRTALAAWATQIGEALPKLNWREASDATSDNCVEVDFFVRYPFRAVRREGAEAQVTPGALQGRFRLEFANGNELRVVSNGELRLNDTQPLTISARLPLNDYVARVLEREGGAAETHAMRALAIAARSYLIQNARMEAACWRIEDSSRTQRVSANPPAAAALDAAWFTDDLVLRGAPVRYHRDTHGDHRLSWLAARQRATQGWGYERILAEAYPRAHLAALTGIEDCARIAEAESWLARSAPSWQRRLQGEVGFEAPAELPRVCTLGQGRPYSDASRMRIYVRGWRSLDERVTLAHEYLHLALRFHPKGMDEIHVERLARRLIEG